MLPLRQSMKEYASENPHDFKGFSHINIRCSIEDMIEFYQVRYYFSISPLKGLGHEIESKHFAKNG